jgi:hypothetical protein
MESYIVHQVVGLVGNLDRALQKNAIFHHWWGHVLGTTIFNKLDLPLQRHLEYVNLRTFHKVTNYVIKNLP